MKLTILVAEDSATQAEALREVLERNSFHVVPASDGIEALERAREIRPSIILSDVIMPRLDGFGLCMKVKQDQELRRIPVILLTALSDPGDVVRGLECGADIFVTKPYDERYLLSRIKYVLDNPPEAESGEARKEVPIILDGHRYGVGASRRQILDLLLSTYEAAIYKNQELAGKEAELLEANRQLERRLEELRAAEVRYKTVADNTYAFEYWLDPEGRFLYASPSSMRVYGRQPEEFLADPSLREKVILPEDRPVFERHRAEEAARAPGEMEVRIMKPDGNIRWVSHSCQPVFDRNGTHLGQRGSSRDVTEHKQAEEALRKAHDELETRVQERTAQLRSLALELTQAESRERQRLAVVLHDHLQQLMVGAKMRLQILEKRASGQGWDKELQGVFDLLDESIKASRSLAMELSPPILQDQGLVAAVCWLAKWMEEKHGLVVEVTSDGQVPADAAGVSTLIYQSVRELLFNIVKHARTDKARIEISTAGGELKAVISDAGAGFDPSKADAGASGAGFGLSSVRERIRLLGGTLSIDSAPGAGTRVIIQTPLPPAQG